MRGVTANTIEDPDDNMYHQHTKRIDQLFEILESHRGNKEGYYIPRTDELNAMRAERLRLVKERWIDLVAKYGNPLLKHYPKNAIDRRGLPVAVNKKKTLLEMNAAE